MTDNIIPFAPKKIEPSEEMSFLLCPCTQEGEPFLILTKETDDNPVIIGLICPNCEQELCVTNGIVHE